MQNQPTTFEDVKRAERDNPTFRRYLQGFLSNTDTMRILLAGTVPSTPEFTEAFRRACMIAYEYHFIFGIGTSK